MCVRGSTTKLVALWFGVQVLGLAPSRKANQNYFILGGSFMRSTGIVRKIDPLGRVVLPIELRNTMDLQEGTPLEIFTEGNTIILRKYVAGCEFCGSMDKLKEFGGKQICSQCISKIGAVLNGKG